MINQRNIPSVSNMFAPPVDWYVRAKTRVSPSRRGISRALPLLVALVWSACSHPRADDLGELLEAYDNASVAWPGFDPGSVPLAIYDDERTYLIRYPEPPQIFSRMRGLEDVVVADTVLEGMNANTDIDMGGQRIAVVGVDWDADPVSMAAVMVHEAFHAYQTVRHPDWTANEVDLFTYPIRSAALLEMRRLEGGALRRAVTAPDSIREVCWAEAFVQTRTRRFARLPDEGRRYEQISELREGVARYLQASVEGREPAVPGDGFPPEDVRERAYTTGHAIAVLLDRLVPGWKRTLSDSETLVPLERLLADGLEAYRVPDCGPSPDERARTRSVARDDSADLTRRDARARAAFDDAPGWSVELVADATDPLQVQQFDPLNVRVLDDSHVLHTRWVGVGNERLRAEARDRTAMTRGLPGHPLFAGVDRFRVTGLTEPEVSEAGDTLRVTVQGLTLSAVGATIERDGQAIRVIGSR